MRRFLTTFVFLFALTGVAAAFLYAKNTDLSLTTLMRREEAVWIIVKPDDPRLTTAAQLGLRGVEAEPGKIDWQTRAPGFETGELPMLVDGQPVDRLLLSRFDPKLWRMSVHSKAKSNRDIAAWMKELGATLVVNGSFFNANEQPETPIVSQGVLLGPKDYVATHGALVADAEGVRIVDLQQIDWRSALAGVSDAIVSYPMLIGADGESRAKRSEWLANRSFVGQDNEGRIVVGTSADALLSIDRFANFLKSAPLELKLALNLDGGALSCQAIALGDFTRRICGSMEVQVKGAQIMMAQPAAGGRERNLPIILAVSPR